MERNQHQRPTITYGHLGIISNKHMKMRAKEVSGFGRQGHLKAEGG